MKTKFFIVKQNKIDGYYINNSKIATWMLIEAFNNFEALIVLKRIVYNYSRFNYGRFDENVNETDYVDNIDFFDKSLKPAVVHFKNNNNTLLVK